jgi:hypothetical protein
MKTAGFFKVLELGNGDQRFFDSNIFQTTRTSHLLILKYLKNWNQEFFENSNISTTLVFTRVPVYPLVCPKPLPIDSMQNKIHMWLLIFHMVGEDT